ncbi:hypothetical protein LINGRAHAP2_LOCUS11727 [Linum grandiflorum]
MHNQLSSRPNANVHESLFRQRYESFNDHTLPNCSNVPYNWRQTEREENLCVLRARCRSVADDLRCSGGGNDVLVSGDASRKAAGSIGAGGDRHAWNLGQAIQRSEHHRDDGSGSFETAVMFFMNLSGSCGYTIAQQAA